ncbi:MAG TPA: response regulator transcription factor [Ferruginibacter sp.]|nr:response regulator transcription factor [Chitinophagaceae bacterium]MBK7557525.1 response regulator transcription factor [Chitinophagaceae bacterium]MBK8495511.1 response regulator transcription factor [Chitinophagaceae bacterium]MBK9532942.1 response regulator transcription factor [Chitinophagaceae bacterium]HQW92035.1 response regulator transcription factor [Ferruginibacter sp.]
MLRILIADDHHVVRKGLRQILLDEFPTSVIEDVADAEELIKKVMHAKWDVVISDLSMPGRSGLDALQQIKLSYPDLPVLILSIHPEEQYALRALKSGASGYLSKDAAPDELVKAVKKVMLGKKYISQAIAEKLANSFSSESLLSPHENLSDREFDVMKLLANGQSVSEIAERLSLSVTTVSTYRARVMVKMHLKSNSDLTRYAIEYKLI